MYSSGDRDAADHSDPLGAVVRAVRPIASPYVATQAQGVCIRDRLKGLSDNDEQVLHTLGAYLGRLASMDLARRVRSGTGHGREHWSERKRSLTAATSSRWAGSITKETNDLWELARRSQYRHAATLRAAIRTIAQRLSLAIGQRGSSGRPGGYRSAQELARQVAAPRPPGGSTRKGGA